MKRFLIVLAIASLALAACGPEPEPTLSPADVEGTAVSAALTMIAQTQAAIPTATPIPPSETPSPTPEPSLTPTIAALGTLETPTLAAALPTNAPASGPTSDPCNQPLTSWAGESVKMTMVNDSKPRGVVTLSLFVKTPLGECGYLVIPKFEDSYSMSAPLGSYSAGAFIDGPKNLKTFGAFLVTPGSWKVYVGNDAIILKAGCAPNC